MPAPGFQTVSIHTDDLYDLKRLADHWGLSLADTVHVMLQANLRALDWTTTRRHPIVNRRGKGRPGRRLATLAPEPFTGR